MEDIYIYSYNGTLTGCTGFQLVLILKSLIDFERPQCTTLPYTSFSRVCCL